MEMTELEMKRCEMKSEMKFLKIVFLFWNVF